MPLPPVPEAPAKASLTITAEAPRGAEIAQLIEERLAHSFAHSPPESVHALPLGRLDRPEITFWTARLDGVLVGCAALLANPDMTGEIKSMFLRPAARGRGISRILLEIVEAKARELELSRIDLETGTDSHAARGLYESAGYRPCGPFAHYKPDPNSVFMTKDVVS